MPGRLDQHPSVKPFVKRCFSSRAQSKQFLSLDQYGEARPVCRAAAFPPKLWAPGCMRQVTPDEFQRTTGAGEFLNIAKTGTLS